MTFAWPCESRDPRQRVCCVPTSAVSCSHRSRQSGWQRHCFKQPRPAVLRNNQRGEQGARPNDEERGQVHVPSRASLARSSSSVSFAFAASVRVHTNRQFQRNPKNMKTRITIVSIGLAACSFFSACTSPYGQEVDAVNERQHANRAESMRITADLKRETKELGPEAAHANYLRRSRDLERKMDENLNDYRMLDDLNRHKLYPRAGTSFYP